jgi:hypothetical protein
LFLPWIDAAFRLAEKSGSIFHCSSEGSMKKYLIFLLVGFVIVLSNCQMPGPPLWNSHTYTVTYMGSGNTGLPTVPTDSTKYLAGATVTVSSSTNLTKSGYTAYSWNTAATGSGAFYAPAATFPMGNADVALYAIWVNPPTVTGISPANDSVDGIVATNSPISATFSEPMDATTIKATTFTVSGGVSGTIVYDVPSKTATFTPTSNLAFDTLYTATVTTGVKDIAGDFMGSNKVWQFRTIPSAGRNGPTPINLGTAGNYVILAKTEITDVPNSAITGNLGLSPSAESYITGFSQTNATGYATSPQVTGYLYAANMAPPTSSNLTTAITDMQTAYTAAAGSPHGVGATNLNLGAGTIGASTAVFTPGTYTWGTNLQISGDITLSGGANDTWIFQIAGNLTVGNGAIIYLTGAAQAKNIVWQLSGEATLGTTSQFKGIILSKTAINLQTGATLDGRALAQSGVTLQRNTVTTP